MKHAMRPQFLRYFQGNVAFWGLKSSFCSCLAAAASQAGAAVRLKAGAAKISCFDMVLLPHIRISTRESTLGGPGERALPLIHDMLKMH